MTCLLEFCWLSLVVKLCLRSTGCPFCYPLVIIYDEILASDSSMRRQSEFVFCLFFADREKRFNSFLSSPSALLCTLPWFLLTSGKVRV